MSSNFSKISIVVLQYNNSADTVKCLASVAALDYDNYDVVVVDNASAISEEESVRHYLENSYGKSFEFISSGHNLGYAGGNNLGIRHALEHGADYVLILNPDTTVQPDLLTKLLAKAETDEKIGIVAPIIHETNHSNILKNVGMIGDKIGRKIYGGQVQWLKPELKHSDQSSELTSFFSTLAIVGKHGPRLGGVAHMRQRVQHSTQGNANVRKKTGQRTVFLTGACILVKREVFEDAKLFDERYFLYFEDADFCLRAQEYGYKLAIADDAMIYHTVSASTSKLGSPLLLRYHYRNAHLFNLKNGPWWAILALPFWSVWIIIKQLLKLVLRPSKRTTSLAILNGVLDFYTWKWGKIG